MSDTHHMSESRPAPCPHLANCAYVQRFPDAESRAGFAAVFCDCDSHACARREAYDNGQTPTDTLMPSGVDAGGLMRQLAQTETPAA